MTISGRLFIQNTKSIRRQEISQNYKNNIDIGSFESHHQSKNTKRNVVLFKTKNASTIPVVKKNPRERKGGFKCKRPKMVMVLKFPKAT